MLTGNSGGYSSTYSNSNRQPGWSETGMFSHSIPVDMGAWMGLSHVASATSEQWGPWAQKHIAQGGLQGRIVKGMLGKQGLQTMAGKAPSSMISRGVNKLGSWFGVENIGGQLGTWASKVGGNTGKIGLGARGALGFGAQAYHSLITTQLAAMVPMAAAGTIGYMASYGASKRRERKQLTGSEMYGRGFQDSSMAATMRQTAISQIQGSQIGVSRALSREASFMHR